MVRARESNFLAPSFMLSARVLTLSFLKGGPLIVRAIDIYVFGFFASHLTSPTPLHPLS